MQIEIVSDKKGLDRFIRFPWVVYEGDPNWVPPLISEMKFILGEENPFFHHAEAAYFLATESGNTVGRIAAIIDRNHINTHNEQAGFFGFFECLPDPAIARMLLDAAAAWLRERAIEIMRGPMNPSTNDECGFLLEGFDLTANDHDAVYASLLPRSHGGSQSVALRSGARADRTHA